MSMLLECKNIKKEYGDLLILDKVNLNIKVGEKIALVGTNGIGKTTLANIIYGTEEAEGSIRWFKDNIKIGYMKQATDYCEEYNTLSGGEKTKKLLKELLYGNYDMLILDEPTNHLDYLGVSWLIKNIKKFKGTVFIISHDRYFLDSTVNRIIEIEDKKLINYNGNYTWYREKKKKDYEDNLHKYIEQEKIENRINKQINDLKRWSEKAHRDSTKKALISGCKKGVKEFYRAKAKNKDQQIKSKIKKLEKLKTEGVTKPNKEEKIVFHIDKANKIGSIVVRADNISKTFGNKMIFKNSSFYIKRNEKIGLYGINGCGKTTLIKEMLGELDIEGNLYINNNSNIGYISQDVIGLDEESEILELFDTNNQKLGDIITKLNLLGFPKKILNKKVKVLSLGERMKLKILLMVNSNCDMLILDEPTNHIDLHVREQLEEVLKDYNGTIILVSHDRYLLKKVCNKLLVFKDNKIFRYEGGIDEYLNKGQKKEDEYFKKEIMILENKISSTLGKLCSVVVGSDEYVKLDIEYKELIKNLKEMNDKI